MQSQDNFTGPFKLTPQEEREGLGFAFLTGTSCFIFLYVNGVMLYTLRSKPVFRETPRYILLYNLLFADTFQLALSQIMYLLALASPPMVRFVCGIITAFTILTADTSSLTLAVMSLERYVAVCYPLRHATIVTIRGTGVAIAVVWVGVIIILSYFGVIVAARSASSDKASTSKARKTVLLHLIQLCLSLSTTLISTIIIEDSEKLVDERKCLK
ncbi:odorant receptor 131-2-like [Aplochiton taeniatus]